MGLTNKKEEQLRQMPVITSRVARSKDGKFLIHKTEIVTIRPMAYYEAVLNNSQDVQSELDQEIFEEN